MTETVGFQREKMRELILFIAHAQKNDESFGRVKLAKLLYYADNEAFLRLGKPITRATYQKLKDGPAAREFLPLKEEMITRGEAEEKALQWPNGFTSLRLVALRDPKTEMFGEGELALVKRVLDRYKNVGGTAISKLSHEEVGWKVAQMNTTIPYSAYLLAPKMSKQHRTFAIKKAKSLSLVS